jgi:hypothetical protein
MNPLLWREDDLNRGGCRCWVPFDISRLEFPLLHTLDRLLIEVRSNRAKNLNPIGRNPAAFVYFDLQNDCSLRAGRRSFRVLRLDPVYQDRKGCATGGVRVWVVPSCQRHRPRFTPEATLAAEAAVCERETEMRRVVDSFPNIEDLEIAVDPDVQDWLVSHRP